MIKPSGGALLFQTKEEKNMEQKRNKKIIVAIVALLIVAAAMFAVYRFAMPQGTKGDKSITVTVVHGDQTEKVFEYDTDEEYLGPVVTKDGLVEGEEGEFGLFITTVDGETADEAKQEWWCVTKGSEQVIEDGDAFELTLTVGY